MGIINFFIDRPIFASMLSVALLLLGVVAVTQLPVAQYPEVTPPTVSVTASYPGANARVVAETVATPIEQEVNGVENMLYMLSKCTNDGQMTLDVTFKLGTNLDMAQVLVQNRVSIAEAKLPEEVKRQGVTTKKKSPSILLCINLISPDGRYDQLYLSNYATIQIKDALARLQGVGDVSFLGARDYSMRVWLDPNKLASRNMTASDVTKALREQNVQVAAGRIGQPPTPPGIDFQYAINTLGRLADEKQFEAVVVKTGDKGQLTYLRDVVRDTLAHVFLDPAKLKAAGLTPADVVKALRAQKFQVATGPNPLRPDLKGPPFRYQEKPLGIGPDKKTTLHDLVEDKDGIIEDRGVELGAKSYDVGSTLDGLPAVTLAVYQLPGSNAVETAEGIRHEMEQMAKSFPKGVEYRIVYDTTGFIEESIHSVYHTLFEAFALVFIVVLVFLQNWRATLIPMIAVPVSIVGTFALMALFGFSLNNLSLLSLVLAIGIVVDDAIVVVENVEAKMAQGHPPREATRLAMAEVAGPVIAVALVLAAVFVPAAFIPGITGQFYRQFALCIAVSTVISAFNSLTLSPALCALLLKPHGHGHGHAEALPRLGIVVLFGFLAWWLLTPLVPHGEGPAPRWLPLAVAAGGCVVGFLLAGAVNWLLGLFFGGFNKAFDVTIGGYGATVALLLRGSIIVLLIYGGLLVMTYVGFARVPTGFIPEQDKGYLVVNAQLPDGASLERTEAVSRQMAAIAKDIHGVAHTITMPGYSVLTGTNLSNVGGMYVVLEEFEHRKGDPAKSANAIAVELRQRFRTEIDEALVVAFGAPPIDGLGSTGGFKLQVQDRGAAGPEALQGATQELAQTGNAQPGLVGLFSSFSANQPQLFVQIDRTKAKAAGVELGDVFDTLQIYLGSAYVNDITKFNRNWQVNVQADARFRLRPQDIGSLKVRNASGGMVPLSTLIEVRDVTGPAIVNHYNLYPSAEINGSTRAGTSSGQAIAIMDGLSAKMPRGFDTQWTELTLLQIQAGFLPIIIAFSLGTLLVFMVLAAQYESLSLPLAIILIVPMCLLCAILGVGLRGMDNNIFTQVALLVLVGLASKNAILIVEFAKQQQDQGLSRFDAAVHACKMRLRPILMTSFAFILGVVPLLTATGAGAEMRQALGTAVFSGMLGVTLFGIFFTPVFYLVIRWLTEPRGGKAPPVPAAAAHAPEADGAAASHAIKAADTHGGS
jgi:multidrug efflux pump subunit AcrB